MKVLAKTINKTRTAVIAGSALALSIATPAALASAHGFGWPSSGSWDGNHTNARVSASAKLGSSDSNNDNQGNSSRMMSMHRFQQNCAQEQAALTSQAAAIKTADQKRLNGQNILYGGIENYVSTNGVTVANYDAMNSQVASDQTAATDAVNALGTPQLDCTGDSSAAANNRNAIQSYKQAQERATQAVVTYRHDLGKLFYSVLNS